MTAELVGELFDRALALPVHERGRFLERECAGDDWLRREVESLVAHDAGAESAIAGAVSAAAGSIPGFQPEFAGTPRFEILRKIGAGGFGTVYEAIDREHGVHVALKVLHRSGAVAIAQFKREFRTLADLMHPNLTRLYELFSHDGNWFFTMELVDGQPITHAVRTWPERARDIFAQLARGIHALHHAGILHCDLKPSNVLVTPGGRVAILDFGLLREAGGHQERIQVFGTPGYSSPEQLSGEPLTPATDWYSAGVMMKECAGVADLAEALLHPDPKQRLSGDRVLALLDDAAQDVRPEVRPEGFLGRESELALLERAFDDARSRMIVQEVAGPPGIGKTSLARAFLESLAERGCAVFSGRCRNRESIPFKALDEIVETIRRFAAGLPPDQRESLFEWDREPLETLFPQLRQAAAAPAQPGLAGNRTAGLVAFERLLRGLSRDRRAVLWIDDAQWGDRDSAAVLAHLAACVQPIPILLLLTYNPTEDSPFLGDLAHLERRRHSLGPLPQSAAEELVRSRCAARAMPESRVAAIAAESNGNPYLLLELARGAIGFTGLEDAIQRRLASLPPAAQRLARVIAVANCALDWPIARAAAGDPAESYDALLRLEASRLVRLTPCGEALRVEIYHDRVGDALRASLGPIGLRDARRHVRRPMRWWPVREQPA